MLGTSREVLLWVSEYPEYQARTVVQAMDQIADAHPRLCEDFAIIITGDPSTAKSVEETSANLRTQFFGFSVEDFARFQPFGPLPFLQALQERFFSKDLYWHSAAVTDPGSFFGRRSLISELTTQLKSGSGHVGLFGLRRMGKTSLLYRILDNLKGDVRILPVHLDLQLIDAISPTASYFLWTLGEQLVDANSRVQRLPFLRLFGKYAVFSDIPAPLDVLELFSHDLRLIFKETARRVVLLIDEIELMSPEAPGSHWQDTFVRVWRLLRGMAQQFPERLSLFVTGTNPRCTEAGRLGGLDNPIYNYFDRHFLGPLAPTEGRELLANLGQKMGLEWSSAALERVVRYVGGHPLLLRAFGSKVHKSLLPRSEPVKVTAQRVAYLVDPFLRDMSSTLAQIMEVIADQYKDEYYLLETLALGRMNEFSELARAFPADTAHLVGYGLVESGAESSGLRIEVLQTWLQRRHAQRSQGSRQSDGDSLKAGDSVENYVVEAEIGRRGGFARVYRARGKGDARELVALRVFQGGSFSALQREVEILEQLAHPSIVRVIDYGKVAGGPLYLAMEFLDGPTLRDYCERAKRLEGQEFVDVSADLLRALVYLHPDEERLEALREKEALSVEELQELQRARHGYIHRDIKPENVIRVTQRGPVLIDFNISVRVASPIITLSGTPGYFPPDGVFGSWAPDVDLFQTGLTLLQVGLGVEYDGDNLADLREMARLELGTRVAEILLRLTESRRADRYPSARVALAELDSVLLSAVE
ncbi:MAG TPA: protein kinase [Thermoanaerobaculia bacterium]|nr:protein kinase [Thermoanaerobaculia bacterium]